MRRLRSESASKTTNVYDSGLCHYSGYRDKIWPGPACVLNKNRAIKQLLKVYCSKCYCESSVL